LEKQKDQFNKAQQLLLKWIQIILLVVCGFVLVFIFFTDLAGSQSSNSYIYLILMVLVLLGISHYLYQKKNFTYSSRILVLTGVIGSWGSVFIDSSISQGNMFPLVYLTLPIILAGLFTSLPVNIIVGFVQLLGLLIFNITHQIGFSGGVSSLYFYVLFIFAISLIINYLNRFNQRIIDQQVDNLNKLALNDQLTGLYNRHFLNEFLKKEFAHSKREGEGLVIAIMDIDDFKEYNDSLGHDCGDSLLKGLSRFLIENFRGSDIICRFGGDEFLVAMTDCDISDAQKRCNDLAASISAKNMKCTIELNKPLTLSIGIAAFNEDLKSELDLIKAADKALYQAKELGKNRIELAYA